VLHYSSLFPLPLSPSYSFSLPRCATLLLSAPSHHSVLPFFLFPRSPVAKLFI
ncbi:hypothetical protein S245_008022, partial [Arachis hypogaea]